MCFLLVFVVGQAGPPSPADEWTMAIADARKLPVEVAKYTRYLTLFAVPIEDREPWYTILTFHLWSISREAEPSKPRRISPTLYAIYLPDFGIEPTTYGRLTYRDPYFHVALTADGKRPINEVPSPAPWVGTVTAQDELRKLTYSQSPLLRADWFVVETSIQDGRGDAKTGTGYYSFIGVTDRAGFQKAVGADPKLADELKRRIRAIVKESGVSYFPRQIERMDALGGGYWFTLDVLDEGKGNRNPLRQLDREYKHQAEEHYAIGPAGMPWFLLCDQDGKLQNSAPDKLGPDTTRTGRRKIIDVGASCVRCHKEILRPIDSWISEALKAPATAEIDYKQAIETRRLYFRDLQGKLKRDREAFAERLLECNGLTPAKNSELYIRLWDQYSEARLTLADCARELGCSPRRLAEVLIVVQDQKKLDPVLVDLLQPKGNVRREMWEEVYPIAQAYIGGKP